MNHVSRVLTPPIFNHRRLSQWVARIRVLTFITKSMNNESASFVQKGHPYRAFLRNHISKNFRVPTALTVPRVPSALTLPKVPTSLTAPIAPIATTATTATTASTPPRGSTSLVRIPNEQSRRSYTVEVKQSKSSCRSHCRSQAVEVYSFGHSVDSVDSIQSNSDLINRYVYYDPRPQSIRLAVRIWARSRQPSYSATLLVCVIIRSCWKIYKLCSI